LNKQVNQLNARINGFVVPDEVEDPVVNIDIGNDNDDDVKIQPEVISNDTNTEKLKKPKGFQSLAAKIKAEEEEKRWAAKQKEANELAIGNRIHTNTINTILMIMLADRIRELDKKAKETVATTLSEVGPLGNIIILTNTNVIMNITT